MNTHVQTFDERLKQFFELKEAEFKRYAQEQPATSKVTIELAGLYKDLSEMVKH
jgi:hypothetical protein